LLRERKHVYPLFRKKVCPVLGGALAFSPLLLRRKMGETNERFNPEPWGRTILWVLLAVGLGVAFVKGSPIKFSFGEAKIDVGGPSQPVQDGNHSVVSRDAGGTAFVSACPPKTRAVGGNCKLLSPPLVGLRNFGPDRTIRGSGSSHAYG
jgi:hypothetical protein